MDGKHEKSISLKTRYSASAVENKSARTAVQLPTFHPAVAMLCGEDLMTKGIKQAATLNLIRNGASRLFAASEDDDGVAWMIFLLGSIWFVGVPNMYSSVRDAPPARCYWTVYVVQIQFG